MACGWVLVELHWQRERRPRPCSSLQGDADTVNCLEPHPHHLLTMATSGIEDSIKLWTPDAEEPQAGPEWSSAPVGRVAESLRSCAPGGAPQGCSHNLLAPTALAQAMGPAQERVMAANQRSQGEDRRIFLTPQMLQVGGEVLQSRGCLPSVTGCVCWPKSLCAASGAHAADLCSRSVQYRESWVGARRCGSQNSGCSSACPTARAALPTACGLLIIAAQVLLRARGLGALAGSDSDEEGEEGSGDEGEGRRRVHAGDCAVM